MKVRVHYLTPLKALVWVIPFAASIFTFLVFPGKSEDFVKTTSFNVLIGLTVGCSVTSLFLYLLRDKKPLVTITNSLKCSAFDISWNLGYKIYTAVLKKAYVPRAVAELWLKRYNSAVFQAWDQQGNLWGYFSLWPLTEEAFTLIKEGKLKEDEINENHIESRENAPFKRWYIADILKNKQEYHKSVPNALFADYLVRRMISSGLLQLIKAGHIAPDIDFIAFGATLNGKRILKRYGFTKLFIKERVGAYYDVYLKTTHRSDLRMWLNGIETEASKLEKQIKTHL